MKALKDCKWVVKIRFPNNYYWWTAEIVGGGLERDTIFEMKGLVKTQRGAEGNWKRFAKLNRIINWKFF